MTEKGKEEKMHEEETSITPSGDYSLLASSNELARRGLEMLAKREEKVFVFPEESVGEVYVCEEGEYRKYESLLDAQGGMMKPGNFGGTCGFSGAQQRGELRFREERL